MPNSTVSSPSGNGGWIGRCSTKCSFVTGIGSPRPGSASASVIILVLCPSISCSLQKEGRKRARRSQRRLEQLAHARRPASGEALEILRREGERAQRETSCEIGRAHV